MIETPNRWARDVVVILSALHRRNPRIHNLMTRASSERVSS